jgi:putative ABC transport system substrate-binding protein
VKTSTMRMMIILVVLMASGVQGIGEVSAAERVRPFRIGVLTASWGPTPGVVGLRDGLLALGYREHEQFDIGVRFTQGDLSALPAAARQFVHYGVDLIFAADDASAKAAQRTTTQIPIVFTGLSDPVALDLVASFARPGGNITGVADLRRELNPKRLELFHQLVPGLKRVLCLYDGHDVFSEAAVGMYRHAARQLDIVLVEKPVHTEAEARAAIADVRTGDVQGIVQPLTLSLNIPGLLLEVATQRGIPTMFDIEFYVESGGLASYGADGYESGRQAARLVDKILKGEAPAKIPVEVNNRIKFVINLKTAKALGLTIPLEMLYRADRLIR